jgi:hypothetical protein
MTIEDIKLSLQVIRHELSKKFIFVAPHITESEGRV